MVLGFILYEAFDVVYHLGSLLFVFFIVDTIVLTQLEVM